MKSKQIVTVCIISVALFFAASNVLLNNHSNKIADIALSSLAAHADGDESGDGEGSSDSNLNWEKVYCSIGSTYHQYSICRWKDGSDPCNKIGDTSGSCN